MLYTSAYDHLTLLRNNGEIAHKFVNGELVVGTPTGTGAGNEIDFTTQTPADRTIQRPFAGTSVGGTLITTDAGGAGLGVTFFATPPIATGAGTVTAGTRYTVITGPVVNNSVTYYDGETFTAVGTATSGTGTFKLAVPVPPGYQQDNEFLKEHFKIKALLAGDEADYVPQVLGGTTQPGFGYIRP